MFAAVRLLVITLSINPSWPSSEDVGTKGFVGTEGINFALIVVTAASSCFKVSVSASQSSWALWGLNVGWLLKAVAV